MIKLATMVLVVMSLAGCDGDTDEPGAETRDATSAPDATTTIDVTTADSADDELTPETAPTETVDAAVADEASDVVGDPDTSVTEVDATAIDATPETEVAAETQDTTTPDEVVVTCEAPQLECGEDCVTPTTAESNNDSDTTNTVTATSQVRQGVKDAPNVAFRVSAVDLWLDASMGTTSVVFPRADGSEAIATVTVATTGWHTFTFTPSVQPASNAQFPTAGAVSLIVRFDGTRTIPTSLNAYTGALTFLDVQQLNGSTIADSSNDLRFKVHFERCP